QALHTRMIELLIGDDQADRGISRGRRIAIGRRSVPIRLETCGKMLEEFRGQAETAPGLWPIAADEPAVAVGHRAEGVHHDKSGNLGGTELTEGAPLAGMGVAPEIAALHGRSSGA